MVGSGGLTGMAMPPGGGDPMPMPGRRMFLPSVAILLPGSTCGHGTNGQETPKPMMKKVELIVQ